MQIHTIAYTYIFGQNLGQGFRRHYCTLYFVYYNILIWNDTNRYCELFSFEMKNILTHKPTVTVNASNKIMKVIQSLGALLSLFKIVFSWITINGEVFRFTDINANAHMNLLISTIVVVFTTNFSNSSVYLSLSQGGTAKHCVRISNRSL